MRKIDKQLVTHVLDGLLTKLEAFGEQFLNLATTADQRDLAAEFNAFVEEMMQAMLYHGNETGCVAPDPEEQAFHKQHGHETLAGLFAEIRGDEAAGKREDAHWYGRLSLKTMLNNKTETPAAEKGNDKEIEIER
jgi:hypothetical protein